MMPFFASIEELAALSGELRRRIGRVPTMDELVGYKLGITRP